MNRRGFIRTAGWGLASLAALGCRNRNASLEKPPNIILIVTDDQRRDAMGCAGNPIIQTPHMDGLAREGVRFDRAFVTTPICAASRASIFTGLYERTHGYTFTKPPLSASHSAISYPVLLHGAGYRTGFIGKFGIKVEEGVTEEMFDWTRFTYQPYFKETQGERRHLTDVNGDLAVEFLRSHNKNRSFCLSLSFWAPHAEDGEEEQYFWPESCDSLYRDVDIPVPKTSDPAFFEGHPDFIKKSLNRTRWHWRFDTPEKFQRMVKGYYRMISGIDAVIGRVREELESLGLDRNTIIILTGDNGYFLGERGFAGKWTMHDLSIRVPLIVFDPRLSPTRRGGVRDDMVLNVDLAPTLLELAGLDVPEEMQGQSLLPLLRGDAHGWRNEILCEHLWDYDEIPQTECIRTTRWKYIRYLKHPEYEELYDLEQDPDEGNNLALDPRHRAGLEMLRQRCSLGFKILDRF